MPQLTDPNIVYYDMSIFANRSDPLQYTKLYVGLLDPINQASEEAEEPRIGGGRLGGTSTAKCGPLTSPNTSPISFELWTWTRVGDTGTGSSPLYRACCSSVLWDTATHCRIWWEVTVKAETVICPIAVNHLLNCISVGCR